MKLVKLCLLCSVFLFSRTDLTPSRVTIRSFLMTMFPIYLSGFTIFASLLLGKVQFREVNDDDLTWLLLCTGEFSHSYHIDMWDDTYIMIVGKHSCLDTSWPVIIPIDSLSTIFFQFLHNALLELYKLMECAPLFCYVF